MALGSAATDEQLHQLEEKIVKILRLGVILSAILLTLGLLGALLGVPFATSVMQAGLVILLLTPIFRVIATFFAYIWAKDWVYVLVSALVLGILTLGFLLGKAA